MRITTTLILCFNMILFQSAFAQTARVQIIHNAPTPTVDIYAGTAKLLDNFAYRTATPYIDVPAGVTIPIGVALGTSASSADAIATFPVQFAANSTYVVVATGIVGGTPGFDLKVFDMGKETTANAANVGILFFHGSPDAPTVDVVTGGSPIINDVSYGQFQGYLEVPANATYTLNVTPGNNNNAVVASYSANLSFWEGRTAVIFASGFLGGGSPTFEPWVALSTGGTFPLTTITAPAPPVLTGARLQIIHNSPTPTVDIYVNGALLLDNFAFRTATPYIDVPAGVAVNVAVALANSTSVADALVTFPFTFQAGKRYVAVASGVVGGNPGFDIKAFDMGRETANAGEVGILFFHGSPDAPAVDIITGGAPLFDNVSFGQFSGYVSVPANATYKLSVTPANDNNTIVASYNANLSFWGGRTAVVFASGFLGGGSAAFEPWVALNTGGTFPLPLAPFLVEQGGGEDRRSASLGSGALDVKAFPNPAYDRLNVNLSIESETEIQATVFSTLGQAVITKNYGTLSEGTQSLEFEVYDLPKGNYFLHLRHNNGVQTVPFVVIKP